MVLPRLARRRVDIVVGAVIAVLALSAATIVYLGSDSRATTLTVAPEGIAPSPPTAPAAAPAAVQQIWQLDTDPRYGAAVTPYGSVAVADEHSVRGYASDNGTPLWSYERSNLTLCGIGSGDTAPDPVGQWTGVHGVMTLFAKNGYCSQVTLLDPASGERLYQRTSPNQDPGQLFFGTPYVGWMGTDYLELWRHDLVATIRYGNQPNPVNANGPHLGCTFSDAAATADQLVTIEHCGGETNLVLNWPTPSDAKDKGDKNWDANHSSPKATVPLGSVAAVILAVTADRAAVLVAEPAPAVVIYDTSGQEISRTPVDMDAAEIVATAAAGITPSVTYQSRRYTVVGTSLFSFSSSPVTVPAPPADDAGASDGESSASSDGSTDASESEPATVTVQSPVFDWRLPDALGLPARIGADILLPTPGGIAVADAASGAITRTITVDRAGYTGRVDVRAVGDVLVETRGATVVGLGAVG